MKKISIIGQGYVGLTLAMAASKSYKIIGFDSQITKVDSLLSGISYVEDVSNIELIEAMQNGSYIPTTDASKMEGSDVFVICVPTPLDDNRQPDLKFIEAACNTIAGVLTKPALIINESTSFAGTLRDFIKPIIESKSEFKCNYAVAPERVDPGRKDFTVTKTPRLLAGIDDISSKDALDFYNKFCSNMVMVTSPEVAETAKLFENTFRQVNIALVNELATITNSLGISVYDVLDAANTKPYGFMRFNPGPGVGGHCIPVDPTYLAFSAEKQGVSARFIELANKVNLDMPRYIVERCKKDIGDLKGIKVLLVGVSYKPNISDTRETPAEELFEILQNEGADVYWHDPLVESWKSNKIDSLVSNFFDLTIIQTAHDLLDFDLIKNNSKFVFDCTGKISNANHL